MRADEHRDARPAAMPTTLVWLRNSLRLADHPALAHAAERGAVVPAFVWAPDEEGAWAPGGAHRWWLHESLAALDADLREKGSRLILRHGKTADELLAAARASGADRVVWMARVAPTLRQRDELVRSQLEAEGLEVRTFAGRILHDPETVCTGQGDPYRVFTPFYKRLRAETTVGEPLPVPRLGTTKAPDRWPASVDLDALGLTPEQQDGVDWAAGMRATWTPGEAGARARLDAFLDEALVDYPDGRDRPDQALTSMLSPHLHWGEVSAREVWTRADAAASNGTMRAAADKFQSELAWREFAYHVLHHFPETPTEPLKAKYAAFPWRAAPGDLEAWQQGKTGYPIVDAGMRQLWAIGWMHNRLRMIVASFLTKDLLVPWQDGARWFWDTLCGGDLANNTLGWQWAAGCGADAQPFFRIFNPVSQGQTHDPDGAYVREWVPELAGLPSKWIHRPWEAPADVLAEAGVTLGETYPAPIADHAEQRRKALDALKAVNG